MTVIGIAKKFVHNSESIKKSLYMYIEFKLNLACNSFNLDGRDSTQLRFVLFSFLAELGGLWALCICLLADVFILQSSVFFFFTLRWHLASVTIDANLWLKQEAFAGYHKYLQPLPVWLNFSRVCVFVSVCQGRDNVKHNQPKV